MFKPQNKRLQRLLIIGSSVAFIASTGVFIVGAFLNRPPQPETTTAVEPELAAKEKAYERVLEREPENAAALVGLAQTRIEMNNREGAIAPLERLVELYPEREDLKQLLEAYKQQVAQEKSEGTEASPSNSGN